MPRTAVLACLSVLMVGPLEAAAGPQENDPASASASNRIDDSVDELSPADAEHPPDDPHLVDNGHAVGDDHDGQHGHHDPHDLSHANATAKLEDPTEWRYDLALCTFAVFMVLLALLRVVAWRPLMTGLERREGAIAARIDEAERDAAEAAAQLQAYREKLAGAAQEAQEVIARARREAEAVAERVRGAAAEDAQRERERALADIRTAKEAALREVAEQGADLALGLAGRIVRRELKPQDHAELVREALGRFPSEN